MLIVALLGDVMIYAGPGPYDYSTASFNAALELQATVTNDWLDQPGVVGT